MIEQENNNNNEERLDEKKEDNKDSKALKSKKWMIVGVGVIGIVIVCLVLWLRGIETVVLPVEKVVEVVDEDSLKNVGDWTKVRYYDDQLEVIVQKQAGELDEKVDFDGVVATIKQVQLVRYEGANKPLENSSNMPKEYIKDDSFYGIRVVYDVDKIEDSNIIFYGIQELVTNAGDKIDATSTYYLNDIHIKSALKTIVVPISYDTASKVSNVSLYWGGYLNLNEPVKDNKRVTKIKFLKNEVNTEERK